MSKTLTDELSGKNPFVTDTILSREEVERLVPEITTTRNLLLFNRYITDANRKMADIFGLNRKIGWLLTRMAPFYTSEEIESIAIKSGICSSEKEASDFVKRYLGSGNMKNGTFDLYERNNGSFLTVIVKFVEPD